MATTESTSPTGLAALELIATGHPEALSAESAGVAQIKGDPTELTHLRDAEVRIYAIHRIGETGRPEAIAWLSALKQADFGADTTGQLWPSSQTALQHGLLLNIKDQQMKVQFLEKLAREDGGSIASFATDELCNMGAMPSLPVVAASVRKRYSGEYAEGEVAFCEARVRTLASNPDRTTALAGVLKVTTDRNDLRLIQWAGMQLESMQTPEAIAALDRFAALVATLRAGSTEREVLGSLPESIVLRGRAPR